MAIKLYKGDDSNFANLRTIGVVLNSPFDMTGWRAELSVQGIRISVADISSGEFSLVFSDRETRHLDAGDCTGTLILIDSSGRRKTLAKDIPFTVTDTVDENTDDEITFNITVDAQVVNLSFESATLGAETLANKVTVIDFNAPSNLEYPSESAVVAGCVAKGAEVYTVTGSNTLKTLDLSNCTMGELCDLVGTLIETLQTREIIQ